MADKSSFRRSEVEAQRSAELSEALKPAFGVSAQRKRRSTQDPEAAKNVPLDVARGFVSGALGQLGDLESLIRMLPGFDEKTIIPTSEEIESNLPFRSDTPVSRAMTGAGQLAGSFYGGPGSSVRAAFGLPRAIKRAGQDFAMAAGQSGPRIFIGPKAKTWDQAAADAAQRMEQAGADPVEIWRQTGTFRGADGIQRQEISDVGAQFRNANEIKELAKTKKFQAEALKEQIKGVPGQKDLFPKALTEARRPAREQVKQLKEDAAALSLDPSYRGQPAKFVLEHPELYKAYPELADINVAQGSRSGDDGTRAALMGGKGGMEMEVTRRGLRDDPRSSMLHEMQHAVQTLEDMAPGGSTNTAFRDPRAFEILEELRKKAATPMTFEEYAKHLSHIDEAELAKSYPNYVKSIPSMVKGMDRELQSQAAMEYYKRLAGEAEARATQFREPMGPTERRQEFPYSSYDVPAEDLIVKDPKQYAAGGKVHISDNPDTMRLELAGGGAPKAIAQRLKTLREQLAERSAAAEAIQARDRKLPLEQIPEGSLTPEAIEAEIKRMREEKGMAAGGAAKLAKLLRAPAKSKQEIEAIAERVAPQVTGEYVRKKPGSAITVADKTKKQFEREKTLPVDIRATGVERTPQPVDIERLKGEVMIGIAGDPTVTGKTLHSVGDVRLESPAPQHGGPLYGLYHDNDHFWASGLGAARKVQNLAKEASQQYDAPVVGKYVMMGPDSINYALHFADANLQAIDLSKMSKRQIEGFNKLLRQGSPASGPRPNFPGIEDKGDAYLQFAFDPELRKHFNALMQQPTVTEKFGLPSGTDIRFAVTEPALRDLETGVTGYSMGRMKPEIPATELKLSEHPTYSHDIPGEFMGQSRYPIPYELSFPDTLKVIRENPAQAPYEFGSLKMVGPRQIVDQQMIDEIKAYEERMKQLTGKKKGGAVEKAAGGNIDKLTPRQMLYLSSSEDIAKLTPHQQREVVANMGGDELRQRMSGYFAKGGAVKKTKVSDNPDTMRLELMKAKG